MTIRACRPYRPVGFKHPWHYSGFQHAGLTYGVIMSLLSFAKSWIVCTRVYI